MPQEHYSVGSNPILSTIYTRMMELWNGGRSGLDGRAERYAGSSPVIGTNTGFRLGYPV